MQKYSDIVLGQNGQTLLPIAGAKVTITTSPGNVLATIYSDNGVTIQVNPMTTDQTGRFAFYAANGRYTPQYTYLSVSQTLPDIILQDDPTQANTSVITGGSVDNTPIGATTPSTGVFTSLISASGALNATVGAITPNTGSFTSLSSTSGVLNGTLGATTPNTVSATTIVASSTITPSQTSGIVGTTTNNNANAGSVGEYASASTSTVSVTTATQTTITSISLTAGDWNVTGILQPNPAGGTTTTSVIGGLSTVNNTFSTVAAGITNAITIAGITAGPGVGAPTVAPPLTRFSLSTTTTIFLIGYAAFSGSTMTMSAFIQARRIR